MRKLFSKSIVQNILLICLAVLALVSVFQGVRNSFVTHSYDFQYDSAKIYSLRINLYDECLEKTDIADRLGLSQYYSVLEPNQFPSFIFMLVPFTVFPPEVANFIWLCCNLLFTVFIILLIRKLWCATMPLKIYMAWVCLVLAGLGWRVTVGNGQHALFSVFFFLFALYMSEKKHWLWSGLLLAVSLFKYTLIAPVALWFIYKRRYKELFVAGGVHIALTAFSAYWLRDSFINMIAKPLQITAWLGDEGYIDFGALFHMQGHTGLLLTALVMLIFVGIAFFASYRYGVTADGATDLLVIMCYVTMVIVYHREYDFFLWIIPCVVFCQRYLETKQYRWEMLISCGMFLYSNYLKKVQAVLNKLIPAFVQYSFVLNYLLAFCVYGYIIYLTMDLIKKAKQQVDRPILAKM